MRIEQIEIINFRYYKNVSLKFKKKKNDIHIIIGNNGTGKTTLLNAITWCIYGEELFNYREYDHKPLLNTGVIEQSADGTKIAVEVTITIGLDDQEKITLCRMQKYELCKKKILPSSNEFKITHYTPKKSYPINDIDEQAKYMNRLFPESIKDYFLFDMESLDNYLNTKSGKINNGIQVLAKVQILDKILERIPKVQNKLSSNIKNKNKSTEQLEKEKSSFEDKFENKKNELKIIKEQIDKSDDKIQQLESKLRNIPNVEEILTEIDKFDKELVRYNNLHVEINNDYTDSLYNLFINNLIFNNFEDIYIFIDDLEKKGELPPTIDPDLLNQVILKKQCSICGTKLNEESLESLRKIIQCNKIGQQNSYELLNIRTYIKKKKNSVNVEKINVEKKLKQKDSNDKSISDTNQKIEEKKNKIKGLDANSIKADYHLLEQLKEIRDDNVKKSGAVSQSIDNFKTDIQKLHDELKKIYGHDIKAKQINDKIDRLDVISNEVQNIREKILFDVIHDVSLKSNEYFKGFMWKTNEFDRIEFDENASIKLYDKKIIHISALHQPRKRKC